MNFKIYARKEASDMLLLGGNGEEFNSENDLVELERHLANDTYSMSYFNINEEIKSAKIYQLNMSRQWRTCRV